MCGICGKLVLNGPPSLASRAVLRPMMDSIHHRGPDDEGMYFSESIALGHTRLSIIDLATGKQPLSNEDGTVWVVFNGEIYNFKELTAFLKGRGHTFRTATDTEVIVHLYEEYGEDCISRLRGMFSFALWDDRTKALLIARDRVGIKPLYFHLSSSALIFASEVKAILADPSVSATVDPSALGSFLTCFYTPGEKTTFKDIQKLSPGHYLFVRNGKVAIKKYWDLQFQSGPPIQSLDGAMNRLVELLGSTVRDHMVSDVPVGVLLSGGVDSTAMLSFAVEETQKTVRTFTIGFQDPHCTDERPYARLAAEKYQTEHYEMTLSPQDFLDFLPRYVWHMEEPVCEPPAIALYYVSKLAKDHGVTVLISGEGGDEAFAGYQTYRNLVWLERIKSILGPMTGPVSEVAKALGTVGAFKRVAKYAPLLNVPLESYYYSRTANPFVYFLKNRQEMCTSEFISQLSAGNEEQTASQCFNAAAGLNDLDRMLYVDTKTWLPDDLLIKADKMTMANSLELRVPLLDHQILEFAASLPPSYKLNGLTTKYILKKALLERVPKEIRNRKKTGFPVPYTSWIRKEFNDVIWSVLTDSRTVQRGYFRRPGIEQLLKGNVNGHDYSREIFSLLTLELWHRTFIDREKVVL